MLNVLKINQSVGSIVLNCKKFTRKTADPAEFVKFNKWKTIKSMESDYFEHNFKKI